MANLDANALRQALEKTQTLCRQRQGRTTSKAGQAGVREIQLAFQYTSAIS